MIGKKHDALEMQLSDTGKLSSCQEASDDVGKWKTSGAIGSLALAHKAPSPSCGALRRTGAEEEEEVLHLSFANSHLVFQVHGCTGLGSTGPAASHSTGCHRNIARPLAGRHKAGQSSWAVIRTRDCRTSADRRDK